MHVNDLKELEPVMRQAENICVARHVSFDDLLKLFSPEIHGKIRGIAIAPGVTHVVAFECLDMWSSNHGKRQALAVGEKPAGAKTPSSTLAGILGKPHSRLGDVPSRFYYPVAYASVDELRAAAPADDRQLDASRNTQ